MTVRLFLANGVVIAVRITNSITYGRLSVPRVYASVLLHMARGGDPQWRSLGELTSIGMTMVLCTVIGLGAGYWVDRWLGTSPWLMLAGLLLGIAAGFVNLFRSAKTAERRMDKSEHD